MEQLIIWGGIICAIFFILYRFGTISHTHWKKKGVYYLAPTPVLGNLTDRFFQRKSFHEVQRTFYNKFKGQKVGGFFEGHRPVLMILDLELIKTVLIKDFDHFVDRPTHGLNQESTISNMLTNLKGQNWKQVRNILTPTFSSGKLKYMEDLVNQRGLQIEKYLSENVKENVNEVFEMKTLFGNYTMDVIATCALGVKSDSINDCIKELLKIIVHNHDVSLFRHIVIYISVLITPKILKFFPEKISHHKSFRFVADIVKHTITERKKNESSRRNDLLQLMLDTAQKEKEENGQSNNIVMTEEKIISQAILFLLAGFDTSSTLLSFASYELALNPHIQEKARVEVRNVLDKYNGNVTYEALQEMNYLEMILLETLRKHPPVARIDRLCTKRYNLPETNVTLDENDMITISVIGIHHDSMYYPDPHVFNPERFSPDEKKKRPQYTFLPFGTGPRNCLGLRFAIMSSKVGLIYLLKDFAMKTCSKSEVPVQYSKHSVLLKPNSGIWLKIEEFKKKL